MKKILSVLTIPLFFTAVFLPQFVLAGAVDVEIYADETFKSTPIKENKTIAQMFVPHENTTIGIAVFTKFNNGDPLTMKLYDHENLEFMFTKTIDTSADADWQYFTVDPDKNSLVPDQHYSVQLETTSDNMSWAHDISNPYDEGYASKSSEVWLAADFGLKTYYQTQSGEVGPLPGDDGGDDLEEDQDQTDSQQANDSDGGEKIIISKDVKPPTNLKASWQKGHDAIMLVWQGSETQNIEDYWLYRSLKKDEEYEKVAQFPSSTLSYLERGLDKGQTYYYKLKAYKNNQTSEYSNIAGATIERQEESSAINQNQEPTEENSVKKKWQYFLWASYIILGLLVVCLLLLYLKRRDDKKRAKEHI